MAGSTISVGMKLNYDGSLKDLAKDASGLKAAMTSSLEPVKKLKSGLINFAALATGIQAVQRSFDQLRAGLADLAGAYAVQETAERRLETVMQQRMGATDAEIQSIKDLASAQQQIGVIGDEVQLSGAQQVATFLKSKSSIDTLLPAMNNLLAQQKGLGATTQDAVSVANLMGKAMQGQTSALTRVGITFSEAEAKVMKYGTESERAAMLAQIITNNVGPMNEQLAQTESGKQQQLANALGDVKEKLGALAQGALPFVTLASQASGAIGAVITLGTAVKTLSGSLFNMAKTALSASISGIGALLRGTRALVVGTYQVTRTVLSAVFSFDRQRIAALALAAAQKVVRGAVLAWTAVQKVLNLVLTANPIGLVITAIGLLVTAVVYAYNNCQSFRDTLNRLWAAVQPLAKAFGQVLLKALKVVMKPIMWLIKGLKTVWNWVQKLLGLDGSSAEVKITVDDSEVPDVKELEDKYADAGKNLDKGSGSAKAARVPTASADSNKPVLNEKASDLKGYEDNIAALQEELQTATIERAAEINQEIAMWQELADAVRNAGKATEEITPVYNEQAKTLKEMNESARALDEDLQNAETDAEAADINRKKAALQARIDARQNAGKGPVLNESASNLKEIEDNISVLQEKLKTASIEEAAEINRLIALWQKKGDAIRNAGKAAVSTERRGVTAFKQGWSAAKGLHDNINKITEALKGNGNAWQTVSAIIDGVLGIYEGIQSVIGLINMFTTASQATATAKTGEAAATTAAAVAQGVAAAEAPAAVAAELPIVTANKAATASYMELAAAAYFAAHAYIPFAGFALGEGFANAAKASVEAMGAVAFAEGGIISGPTLGLMGEYPGASHNPEVVAPLNKLQDLIEPAGGAVTVGGRFVVAGRDLVAVMANETRVASKSGRRTNIKI